jgi:hypothetical protein
MDKLDGKQDSHEKFERWKDADAASEIETKNGKMNDKDLELAYGGGYKPKVTFAKKESKKEEKEAKKEIKAENQKKLEQAIKKEDDDIDKAIKDKDEMPPFKVENEKSSHKKHKKDKKVDIDQSISKA